MNKKLLAIAVGAAMVAGATAATAGDEPTWYGKIHMSLDSADAGVNTDGGTYVSSNSSRLGIKGKVALDGGMNAVYKYEMSTSYTGGLSGNRNAYAGLNTGGHTVVLGRHDMPFKTVGRKSDLFGDTIGDTRALTRNNGGNDDWADRRSNVIVYKGKFDAVGVTVAYAPEENTEDGADSGIMVTYKGGPIGVMLATETHGHGNLTGTTDSSGNILAGTYKMGNMKFLAGYMTISDIDGDEGDAGQLSAWTLGGSMKSGKNTFKLQYTSGELDLTDAEATLLAVGASHAFSKKTSAYVAYASIANGDAAAASFGNTGHDGTTSDPALGDSVSGFSLGMVHKF